MDNQQILGLHHITAIAGNAKRNLDFYTSVLGLRLVKKTVNFDDPGTYHFYYGDESGTPGTLLTFFPWEGIGQGQNGTGLATHIGFSVPKGALTYWKERLASFGIDFAESTLFSENTISFKDPDGLQLQFIEPDGKDNRSGWASPEIKTQARIKGFYKVTLTLQKAAATANILKNILGYETAEQQGQTLRLINSHTETAGVLDIIEAPGMPRGYNAAGTNHHIAFRVRNEDILMEFREKILSAGLDITPKINRDYFFSLYFREPSGILFELATDNPGFTVDEPLESLGSSLKLPEKYQGMRSKIEKALPTL